MTSCRDSPSYLVLAETVRDLLLPAETTIQEKWLPAETVRVNLLPAETLGRKLNQTDSLCTLSRKLNHMDSLCRKPITKNNSLSRKQEITDSLCRKRKLADLFIPCGDCQNRFLETFCVVNTDPGTKRFGLHPAFSYNNI